MTQGEKIKVLARAIKEVALALHDAAPECGRCPLRCEPMCVSRGDTYDELTEIIEG